MFSFLLHSRAGHFRYFLICSITKMIFCIIFQVNLTGSEVGFANVNPSMPKRISLRNKLLKFNGQLNNSALIFSSWAQMG